jgi:3-deoxy-D-manno-octulosonate 8-phosphate phosphatase (KDO 8-P phosphatase)
MTTSPGTPQGRQDGSPIDALARRLRLLLFDVDGVMTDGRILMHADGTESKQYHIRDGTGLVLARRSGLLTGLLSARSSAATLERARQLAIPIVRQGAANKLTAYDEILAEHGLADHEVAFMGDDVQDLPVLTRVGLSCAPADAVPEVRARVQWISTYGGGTGAVRELIELVLRAQGTWDDLVSAFLPEEAR